MRLFWEEDFFGVVGAVIVAATVFWTASLMLSLVGLGGWGGGVLSTAATAVALETISRRRSVADGIPPSAAGHGRQAARTRAAPERAERMRPGGERWAARAEVERSDRRGREDARFAA